MGKKLREGQNYQMRKLWEKSYYGPGGGGTVTTSGSENTGTDWPQEHQNYSNASASMTASVTASIDSNPATTASLIGQGFKAFDDNLYSSWHSSGSKKAWLTLDTAVATPAHSMSRIGKIQIRSTTSTNGKLLYWKLWASNESNPDGNNLADWTLINDFGRSDDGWGDSSPYAVWTASGWPGQVTSSTQELQYPEQMGGTYWVSPDTGYRYYRFELSSSLVTNGYLSIKDIKIYTMPWTEPKAGVWPEQMPSRHDSRYFAKPPQIRQTRFEVQGDGYDIDSKKFHDTTDGRMKEIHQFPLTGSRKTPSGYPGVPTQTYGTTIGSFRQSNLFSTTHYTPKSQLAQTQSISWVDFTRSTETTPSASIYNRGTMIRIRDDQSYSWNRIWIAPAAFAATQPHPDNSGDTENKWVWYCTRTFFRFAGCHGHPEEGLAPSSSNQEFRTFKKEHNYNDNSVTGFHPWAKHFDNRPPVGFDIVSASFWFSGWDIKTVNRVISSSYNSSFETTEHTGSMRCILVASDGSDYSFCTEISRSWQWEAASGSAGSSLNTVGHHFTKVNLDRPYSKPFFIPYDSTAGALEWMVHQNKTHNEVDYNFGGPGLEVPFNANAIEDINNNEFFDFCIMEYDHDFLGVAPTNPISHSQWFTDSDYDTPQFQDVEDLWEGVDSKLRFDHSRFEAGYACTVDATPSGSGNEKPDGYWKSAQPRIQYVIKPEPGTKIRLNGGTMKIKDNDIYLGKTSKLDDLSCGGMYGKWNGTWLSAEELYDHLNYDMDKNLY